MNKRVVIILIVAVLLGGAGGVWWLVHARQAAVPSPTSLSEGTSQTNGSNPQTADTSPNQHGPSPSSTTSTHSPDSLTSREHAGGINYYVPTGNGEFFTQHTVAEYLANKNQASTPSDTGVVSIPDQTAGTGGAPATTPSSNGAEDPDHDGLTNDQELQLGTNPNNPDTDGDGLTDGEEVRTYRTDPKRVDTDGDGLTDGEEVTKWKTDPLNPDTDGDGYPDGAEAKGGYNPKGPGKL